MPSASKNQGIAMNIAKNIKEGKTKPQAGSPSAGIAKSMNLADIKDFASTPTKGLPAKAPKSMNRSAGGMPPGEPAAPKMPMASTPTSKMPMAGGMMGGPMKMNNLGGVKKVK